MSAAGSPAGLLLTQGMPVCEPDKGASSWAAAALDPAPQPLGGRPVLTPPVAACSPQEPIHGRWAFLTLLELVRLMSFRRERESHVTGQGGY